MKVKNNNDKLHHNFSKCMKKIPQQKNYYQFMQMTNLQIMITLDPGAEKVYRIDATSVEGKVAIDVC